MSFRLIFELILLLYVIISPVNTPYNYVKFSCDDIVEHLSDSMDTISNFAGINYYSVIENIPNTDELYSNVNNISNTLDELMENTPHFEKIESSLRRYFGNIYQLITDINRQNRRTRHFYRKQYRNLEDSIIFVDSLKIGLESFNFTSVFSNVNDFMDTIDETIKELTTIKSIYLKLQKNSKQYYNRGRIIQNEFDDIKESIEKDKHDNIGSQLGAGSTLIGGVGIIAGILTLNPIVVAGGVASMAGGLSSIYYNEHYGDMIISKYNEADILLNDMVFELDSIIKNIDYIMDDLSKKKSNLKIMNYKMNKIYRETGNIQDIIKHRILKPKHIINMHYILDEAKFQYKFLLHNFRKV